MRYLLLDEFYEQEVARVREDSQREDEPAAAQKSHAVVASKASHAVRIVEEAIDARVVELLGHVAHEEVTVEPTELAQHFVARNRAPNVDGNQDLQRRGYSGAVLVE